MPGQSSENQNAVAVINPKLKTLQDLYQNAVRDCLGSFSKIDGDGNIVFKFGGLGKVWISIDADDLGYFRLLEQVVVGRWNDENEFKALRAANSAAAIKCAKLSIQQRDGALILINAAEAFLASPEQIPSKEVVEATLERYTNILSAARQKFTAELEKLGDLSE